jgi:hypothetical protein
MLLRALVLVFVFAASIDAIRPPDYAESSYDFKQLSKHKRRYAKHPLLITKDDDHIVEDNIIVESNILRLIRPKSDVLRTKRDPSQIPHKRVARGWNLQYVVVPQQYYLPPQKPIKGYKKKTIGYRYY